MRSGLGMDEKVASLKIGDVVEVKTSRGFSYLHYTHKHRQYGALLRAFAGFHDTRPSALPELMARPAAFQCFFPLRAALDQGIVSVVGNVELSASEKNFPTFRAGVMNPATRKVDVWWLWNGQEEWKVGDLTAEQRRLSIRGVWNDTLLRDRLESEWWPETDSA